MTTLPWIQTYTGKEFTPTCPRQSDIDIVDIAHALSLQCRFNGHINRFYSVAEHCYYVSMIVPTAAALRGLLHDAAEAYVSDVPAPLKTVLPEFVDLEDRLMASIEERFGLTADSPLVTSQVHLADKWIVRQEANVLLANPHLLSKWKPTPLFTPRIYIDYARIGWHPEEAKRLFLERYAEIIAKGDE